MPKTSHSKKTIKRSIKNYVLPKGKSLGLRTCNADMGSASQYANGFKWPKYGPVKCPDWDPVPKCGNGLHLLPFGEGKGGLLDFSTDAKWLVVEYETKKAIDLDGKIKVPEAFVLFCGNKDQATKWLQNHARKACSVVGSTNTGGDSSTNTGGDSSTNTGGDGSTNTGGDGSTNTGGVRSTNTGGDGSTNTGGDGSTNTGGDGSTNTGGYGSTNTGGHGSTNTGGDGSTNTGGDGSTNTGGHGSTCKSGEMGAIAIWWWDNKAQRYRITAGYVGEDGIKPDTFYRCDENGKLVEVK